MPHRQSVQHLPSMRPIRQMPIHQRHESRDVGRAMILCNTACSASSAGAGTSANTGAPSAPRRYTPASGCNRRVPPPRCPASPFAAGLARRRRSGPVVLRRSDSAPPSPDRFHRSRPWPLRNRWFPSSLTECTGPIASDGAAPASGEPGGPTGMDRCTVRAMRSARPPPVGREVTSLSAIDSQWRRHHFGGSGGGGSGPRASEHLFVAADLDCRLFGSVDASMQWSISTHLTARHHRFWKQCNPSDFMKVETWTAGLTDAEVNTEVSLLSKLKAHLRTAVGHVD